MKDEPAPRWDVCPTELEIMEIFIKYRFAFCDTFMYLDVLSGVICVQGGWPVGEPPQRHAAAAQQHHCCQAFWEGSRPPRWVLAFYDCAACFIKLDNLRASYRDVNSFNKQRRQRILHASPSSGSANGWTTLINMDWVSITLRVHIHPSSWLHLNT